MSLLLPNAQVPLGWVEIRPNVRLPVIINPAWQRSLGALPGAVDDAAGKGPPSLMFVEDMSSGSEGEPLLIPGPAGPPSPPQTVLMLLCEECVEGEAMFIPR